MSANDIQFRNSYTSSEINHGDAFAMKIVLWIFPTMNMFCAFRGTTDQDDETVAKYGVEVDEKVAKLLFPTQCLLAEQEGRIYGNF